MKMKDEHVKLLEKLTYNERDVYTSEIQRTAEIYIYSGMYLNEINAILEEFRICSIIKTYSGVQLTLVHKDNYEEWYKEL